ncbi:MAG: hypothetical protein AAF490_25460 [Chloroflexota bacterium]
MHPNPPKVIDGAIVKFYASGGTQPIYSVPIVDSAETIEIWGLAICHYPNTGKIYRFSCDYNWETQNDLDFASILEAKTGLSGNYEIEKIQWQPMSKTAVIYETGPDESWLIGTKEELHTFASQIVELVNQNTESRDMFGVNCQLPTSTEKLTEPMTEISFNGLIIVDSEKERRMLINANRKNNGLAPIDWKGHDLRLIQPYEGLNS